MFTPEIEQIDITTNCGSRNGYTQFFREKGWSCTHYLVRDSDGKKSQPASYQNITGMDDFYSVTEYFGEKICILTGAEFAKLFAVNEE